MDSTTPETLRDLLDAVAARDAVPVILSLRADGRIDTLSCGDLARRAYTTAASLLNSGIRRSEPVALVGPNSAEWIVAYFGILCAGALPAPVDCQASGRDLARIITDCGARRVLTTQRHADLLRANQAPAMAITLLDDLRPGADAPVPAGTTVEFPHLLPGLLADDVAALFFTSGTTGAPKGVPLTHRNLLSNVQALVATRLTGAGDRVLLPLPLHHTYPFTCGLLGCLATGAALVLPAGVTGPQLVAAIRGAGATVLLGVPRLYTALLAGIEAQAGASPVARRAFNRVLGLSTWLSRRAGFHPGRFLFRRLHREMGPTLRILASGGARLEREIAWRLEGLGWEVLSGYGLTETSPILTFNVRGHVRHETVGRPLPGVEIRIDAPPAQLTGEILARGPNVFAGYRNNPVATRLAFTPDGWFRTGDIGHVDGDGYLHIVGRVKEIIVLPDGKKLVPEDVEEAYAASPLVREVALLEHEGRLVALIVPDEANIRQRGAARVGSLLREEIEAISLGLPAYQRITDYRLTHDALPRTAMGKLQRFHLPSIYAAGRGVTPAAVPAPLSAADRALLESPAGGRIWTWLQQRFAGSALTLEASPQLDLHVDSLEWLALTLEIRDRFGVNLSQEAVARVLTVRDLLNEVLGATGVPAEARTAAAARIGAEPTDRPQKRGRVIEALGMVLLAVDRLLMRLVFRLRVEGLRHLPEHGPLLIAPNHASYLDPMAIAAALPWRLLRQAHWAGWTGFMFRAWHWRLLSRATRVFPVDPDRGPAAAIEAGEGVLARRQVLIWFPEGRRTLTGEIGPFLPGIGVLLRKSGSPAVPLRVTGSFAALPWNRRWPRRVRITVIFGAPMGSDELEAAGEGDDAAARVASGLRRAVLQLGDNGGWRLSANGAPKRTSL